MRLSLCVCLLLALVACALAHDHKHEHHDRNSFKGCEDPVGAFYRRHVQCRQCIIGGPPGVVYEDDEMDVEWSHAIAHKWCAAPNARSDADGTCIPVTESCATDHTTVIATTHCKSDAPASKATCSLCTLDGYSWCQDESAPYDEYAGSCVASSASRTGSSVGCSESGSEDGSESEDDEVINSSDSSEFRDDEGVDMESSDSSSDTSEDSSDSDSDSSSDEENAAKFAGQAQNFESEEASESDAPIARRSTPRSARTCPRNSRVVTSHTDCNSAAVMHAAWRNKKHRHHGHHGVAGIIIPIAFCVIIGCCLKRRCKKRCAERRAARLAAQQAAAAGVVPQETGAPLAVAHAVPAYTVVASPVTTAPTVVVPAPPTPTSQPLLYSHAMGSAPAYAPTYAPTHVEMRPVSSMYPGMAAGGGGYARVGQDLV